jgi:hypothetical protein
MKLTRKRRNDFDDFWRYCLGLLDYAAACARDCKGTADLPLWNKNMVLAYAAVSWSDHKVHDWNDAWIEDSISDEKKAVDDMRKTISELRRKLNSAKKSVERLKTKKGAKA